MSKIFGFTFGDFSNLLRERTDNYNKFNYILNFEILNCTIVMFYQNTVKGNIWKSEIPGWSVNMVILSIRLIALIQLLDLQLLGYLK